MGIWGPGLYQNDIAEDLRTEFAEMIKLGKTYTEATQTLIDQYKLVIDDKDDSQAFWISLADIQWKYGCLEQLVKSEALSSIDWDLAQNEWMSSYPQDVKKRGKILFDLKVKLTSPQPKQKKIRPYVLYKCEWKIGDVYAVRLESEKAKENGLYGRFLLIIKVDESDWGPGHRIPVIYTKLTKTNKLPQTSLEIDDATFVQTTFARRKEEYRMILIATSKKSIPYKNLEFVGNFHYIEKPVDEFIVNDPISMISSRWNELEAFVIRNCIVYHHIQ